MKKNEIVTSFFIARKNLVKNRNALSFTLLIIALGFISSIIIYGVLEDVGNDMQQNFIDTSMGHVMLEPYDDAEQIENVDNLIKQIRTTSHVVGVSPVTKKSARLYDSNQNYIDTIFYIINPEYFAQVSIVDDIIKEGTYLNKGEKNKILVGCIHLQNCNDISAFERIDLGVGENARVVFSQNREAELSLQGIYDHNHLQAEVISYMNEATAKELFSDYDRTNAHQIIIRLSDMKFAEEVVEELIRLNINAKISTGEEKASAFSGTVDSFYVIGNLSFLLGIIISAISIYIVLYINILGKKTQIGIIKAIGIKSRVIFVSYVMLSFFLGIAGSIMGIVLTLIVIEYFKFNPIMTGVGELVPQVSASIFLIVLGAITLASVIAGYLVSKNITKQNIIGSIFHG